TNPLPSEAEGALGSGFQQAWVRPTRRGVVRQTGWRSILEVGPRPTRERLTTFGESTLQVSDVSRVNIPIASAKSEPSIKDLRRFCGVKPGLVMTLYRWSAGRANERWLWPGWSRP